MAFRIPASARRSFWIDVASGSGLSLGLAFLALTTAVLRKSLGAPDWLLALAVALPMVNQLLSPAWSGAGHLRRKVPFFRLGAYLTAGFIALSAASSPLLVRLMGPKASSPGLFGASPEALSFMLLTTLAWFAASGFNVLVTSVYRCNYPVLTRARVVSRINVFKFLAALPVAVGVALLLEQASASGDRSFVWLLVVGSAALVAAALIYNRQIVVGEEAYPAGWNARELLRQLVPQNLFGLLARNPHFLRYQIWQTFHGAGNIICLPAMTMVMVDKDKWNMGYAEYLVITTVIPGVAQIFSSVLWAPLIDRFSPSKARTYNTPFWVLGWLFFGYGAMTGTTWTAYASRAAAGIAMSGAGLIWALGSLHYSRREDPSQLVAAHSFLTGIRGLLFPLVGGWLYVHVGNWVFFIGAASMVIGGIGFYLQDLAERRDPNFISEKDTAAPSQPPASDS
ncbi:MAG: hypothetical protein JXL80_10395 [Planctomycetes bacterium]|nr:hypothetical protein [Planctomycetota bacterium]